ncbi:MAG: thioredoxin domain-containing protein [Patescibacteria group bacterium]
MEENNLENKMASVQNTNQGNGQKQIVGAIIIAGIIIAGAILLKGTNTGTTAGTGGTVTKVSTAKKIGLNVKSFQACLASGKFKDKIQADIDDGSRAGVNGTPSSFILRDGVVVDNIGGAQPLEQVMQKVADALANKKNPTPTQVRPVSPDEHILGNINAKIIIVEYSDLECPFCKVFHNTMHQVVEKSNGEVAWVYRHYPIAQLHSKAFREAEATECAWEQGGNDTFWKYTDKIFEITPSNNRLEESEL